MSVSPNGASDNVFIRVDAGDEFQYEVKIPADGRQGPGLFWYHPHSHGYVWEQLSGGMAGGIVVDGFEQYYPIVKNIPERFLFIENREHKELDIFPINGQLNPAVAMRPGEVEFWRIANINATEFIKIGAPGMPFYVLATDGHPLSRPQRQTQLFIGPGQRFEALVIGPPPGEYALSTIPFPNEAWDEIEPAEQLATIVSSGTKPSAQPSATQIMRQRLQGRRWIDEIRKAPIVHRRKLVYSRNSPRSVFFIDGMTMCEDMVNQTVKLGDTEEWTIINTDEQYHSFHIHQTPFLVTEIDGVRQHEDSLHDTFSTTPASGVGSTSLKVVIPFTDPVIVGKFVYHCHAVDHEDEGMMGVIQVVA
jgi:FtsP/CotA-like multicopper oxidase with cupredoxin domain